MALEKNPNRSIIYLKIKDGFIYRTDDKDQKDGYDTVTGQIVNLGYRDEKFNNSDIKKFQITLTDGTDKYVLSFPVESPAYSSFISFAKNVDLSKPINLHTKADDYESNGLPVKRTKILVSVGEGEYRKFAKGFYSKAGPNIIPPFKKIKYNGKDVYDKTDYLDFLYNVVENDLKPQLKKISGGAAIFKEEPVAEPMDDNDLPF
jgi:hypothetical protein